MILVTGANGLIGSSICRELLQSKIPFKALRRSHSDLSLLDDKRVQWVEGDILDPVILHDLLIDVNTVIHCAAVVSYQKADEKLMYEVNVKGTKILVDMCLEMGVEHFIHLSSIAALGKKLDDHEITEENPWIESPNNSVYARTKYLAEVEVWRAHHEGLSASVVHPSVVLAPGDGLRSSSKLLKYVWDENRFFIDGKLNYFTRPIVNNRKWTV